MRLNPIGIHGGDIYRNHIRMDFSVNVNPLGIPEGVKTSLLEAVETCDRYPDILAENLRKSVSEMLAVSRENLLFGNGASELFMAIIHGIKPRKILIPVPSFYGYVHAAKAADAEIVYYETKAENGFCLQSDFLSLLQEDVDILFLANPNNPTGNLISQQELKVVFSNCREKGILVILDECFIEFCGQKHSILQKIQSFSNVIVIRAFTKIFAIPGVRLGYLVCSDLALTEKISRQLPEWNLSVFAQVAGCACTKQSGFMEKTSAYIAKERQYLINGLQQAGCKVFEGKANFLLLYCEQPLYEQLLERKILIRNCENFKGLSKGYYRIAVKCRQENEILLKMIGEILWKEK